MYKPDLGKRDANEKEIRELLTAWGVHYLQLYPGQGADLIILIHPMEFWEVKNPAMPPSDRKLTPDELELQAKCESRGIPYVVIERLDQAVERIGLYMEREQ